MGFTCSGFRVQGSGFVVFGGLAFGVQGLASGGPAKTAVSYSPRGCGVLTITLGYFSKKGGFGGGAAHKDCTVCFWA